MLNSEKHQLVIGRILRDIYSNAKIAPLLGLKGGSCAYFLYGLTRFSVDLDFDLLKPNDKPTQELIFKAVKNILENYGEVKDSHIKKNTIFFLLSYGDTDHNIKFEINIRRVVPDIKIYYELKEYLGISMLVAKKDYLFAGKLAALTLRSETAMRDIYDIWFFAKNNWDINLEVSECLTGKKIKEQLDACITVIKQVKDSQILRGLGELINKKDKMWVKNHLRQEVIFLLKNYQSVLR